MCSKRKTEANRANAQKSTGPKTEEGKNRSRRNALTHGLCADILFTDGDFGTYNLDEMRDYIEDMLMNRFNELNPQTWEEVFLAKQMMSFEYRLLRCPSIEAEQLRALREASATLYSKPGCYRDADEKKDNAQAHLRIIGIYTFLSSVYRYEKSLFSMLRETRLLFETGQAKRAYDHWRYPNPPVMRIGDDSPDSAGDSPGTPIEPSAANPPVAVGSSRDEVETTPTTDAAATPPAKPHEGRPTESEHPNGGDADVPIPAETGQKPPKIFLRNEPKEPEMTDFRPSEVPIQPPAKPNEALCGAASTRPGDPNTR